MTSSLTKQQMKLSKSIISFSAYRATRTWFSLLFSLKPANKHKIYIYKVAAVVVCELVMSACESGSYLLPPQQDASHMSSWSPTCRGQTV